MRYVLPQPFEEIDHTADVGVVVRGGSPGEVVARLVLAMAQLLTGGGAVEPLPEPIEVCIEPDDIDAMAVDLLRELLYRFDCEHQIPIALSIELPAEGGLRAEVELAPWDEDAHEEGTELKAVTLHEARCEPEGDGWMAQIVFDV
jgi:protein archease